MSWWSSSPSFLNVNADWEELTPSESTSLSLCLDFDFSFAARVIKIVIVLPAFTCLFSSFFILCSHITRLYSCFCCRWRELTFYSLLATFNTFALICLLFFFLLLLLRQRTIAIGSQSLTANSHLGIFQSFRPTSPAFWHFPLFHRFYICWCWIDTLKGIP